MTWNPFDWPAQPFLALYVTIATIVFAFGFSLRSMIGPAAEATHHLTVLELAYLAGGAHRLGDAILLALISGQGATITPKDHKINVTNQKPLSAQMDRPPLLSVRPDMTRQQFQTSIESIIERVQKSLQDLGCYPTDDQITSFRMTALTFVALLLVFGMIKAWVGADRNHPVGILVVLLIFTAFAGIMLAKRPARTRAGKDVLEAYKASHARSSRAPLDHELLVAVALTGPVVLSGTAYAPVYAASQTMSSSGGGCGNSGGGDGGGGGCGGCS